MLTLSCIGLREGATLDVVWKELGWFMIRTVGKREGPEDTLLPDRCEFHTI